MWQDWQVNGKSCRSQGLGFCEHQHCRKNQTAAAMAVGEIAANAAAAAGASPEVVIQSAANRAGMDAAESAREQGMTQPQVEAAAAHEAEEAAKSAGATPDEAATCSWKLSGGGHQAGIGGKMWQVGSSTYPNHPKTIHYPKHVNAIDMSFCIFLCPFVSFHVATVSPFQFTWQQPPTVTNLTLTSPATRHDRR